MAVTEAPRFRFAPSPTGPVHIGSLHTALFNWALARSMGGDFILRIDDTDAARSHEHWTDEMLAALRWLGLDWDEGPDVGGEAGPYVQSQRRQRHLQVAAQLYEQGAAYYGEGDGVEHGPDAGFLLRLRLPREGATVVHDALRGPVRFEYAALAEPALVRSDGSPLYHLAAVVDDHDMAVTHVARGEEWLPSTPLHQHLYEQLGWEPPQWIHLPLILNAQGQKLSKREEGGGALATDFQVRGYLPQALFNYLLLLGWAPPDGKEILGKADVRRLLRLGDLSASPARFDWERLDWFNRHYLQQNSEAQLAALVRPYLEEAYPAASIEARWLERLAALLRDELVRLEDVVAAGSWALAADFELGEDAREALDGPSARPILVQFIAELAQLVLLDEQTARTILQSLQRRFAERHGLSARDVYWPIRAALTGRVQGPALHEIMALLGKDACLQRTAAILRAS